MQGQNMADIIDFNDYTQNRAEPDIEEELECEPRGFLRLADMLMLIHNNHRAWINDREFLGELESRLEQMRDRISLATALIDGWRCP
jgi:hypothetical protein